MRTDVRGYDDWRTVYRAASGRILAEDLNTGQTLGPERSRALLEEVTERLSEGEQKVRAIVDERLRKALGNRYTAKGLREPKGG